MELPPHEWVLTDNSKPLPYQDGSESHLIRSEAELRDLVLHYARQEPRMLLLKSLDGALAILGVGGEVGAMHYYPPGALGPPPGPGLSPRPRHPGATGDLWVTGEGEESVFSAHEVMPVGNLVEILIHLFRHHTLADWIDWV